MENKAYTVSIYLPFTKVELFVRDQSGLNTEKWNPIRAKWAGEFGQHLSMVIVSATQAAVNAYNGDVGAKATQIRLPLKPANVAACMNINSVTDTLF